MDLNVVADFATKTRRVACRREQNQNSFKDAQKPSKIRKEK